MHYNITIQILYKCLILISKYCTPKLASNVANIFSSQRPHTSYARGWTASSGCSCEASSSATQLLHWWRHISVYRRTDVKSLLPLQGYFKLAIQLNWWWKHIQQRQSLATPVRENMPFH
jgi:hypothetical protein